MTIYYMRAFNEDGRVFGINKRPTKEKHEGTSEFEVDLPEPPIPGGAVRDGRYVPPVKFVLTHAWDGPLDERTGARILEDGETTLELAVKKMDENSGLQVAGASESFWVMAPGAGAATGKVTLDERGEGSISFTPTERGLIQISLVGPFPLASQVLLAVI